jgi:hypothetical protein
MFAQIDNQMAVIRAGNYPYTPFSPIVELNILVNNVLWIKTLGAPTEVGGTLANIETITGDKGDAVKQKILASIPV